MKKVINLGSALLLTMMILMASCCRQNPQDLVSPFDKREGNLAINAVVTQHSTRVINEVEWQSGDQIGVFAFTGSDLSSGKILDNKGNRKYEATQIADKRAGTFTSAMDGIWLTSEPANLVAYYPYNVNLGNSFDLQFNVSDQSNHSKIDLLYTKYNHQGKGLTASDNTANLAFDHTLTLIIFRIKTNYDITGKTFELYNPLVDGKLNLVNGIVTTGTSRSDVKRVITKDKDNEGIYLASFILPAQNHGDGVTIHIPGVSKEAKPLSIQTEQGYKYIVNISFGTVDSGNLIIEDAIINPWKDGKATEDIILEPEDSIVITPEEPNNPDPVTPTEGEVINESFASGLGNFSPVNVSGAQEWSHNSKFGCATMSGYDSNTKRSYANEDWLVSEEMNLTNAKSGKLNFEHTWNKGDVSRMKEELTIMFTTNYTGNPSTTKWTEATIPTYPSGTTWDYVKSGDVLFPSSVLGQSKVRFAFKYACTDASSGNWQIKKLVATVTGEAGTQPKPEEPKPEEPTPNPGTPVTIDASFASDLAPFVEYSEEGDAKWGIDSRFFCAKVSGYNDKEKTAYSNVDWLVSPEMNLTGLTSGTLEFEHAINYGTPATMSEEFTLHFTTNYTGNPKTTSWEKVDITNYPAGNNWTFIGSGVINFPAFVMGQSKVRFAFKYKCGSSDAGTWEIKNVKASAK